MKNTWTQLYTKKEFDIFNPKVEDIDIQDIAHALAMKCRFNGHCDQFYSVAEHCVRMSFWDLPGSPEWCLMHDAAEAYLPDIARPIKPTTYFQYQNRFIKFEEIENNILNLISQRFNLSPYNKDEIKKADDIMCATEARDLMGNPTNWDLPFSPYSEKIKPWSWRKAERNFLKMAKQLNIT